MFEINSTNNQLIKDIRKLSRKKYRWKENKYIVEGVKLVEEAIVNRQKIAYIIFSENILEKDFLTLINIIENNNKKITLIKVTDELFKYISNTETPQGVLAVINFKKRNINNILKENRKNEKIIFLDRLQDPGNLGTIIRSADAFKIDKIVVGQGTVDPYNEKVVRATMGSIFRIPIYMTDDSYTFLKESKREGFKIVSTDLNGEIIDKCDCDKKTIYIIGNESNGVDKKLLNISDERIKIPMKGEAESLNAGVAASIIMYELMKNE